MKRVINIEKPVVRQQIANHWKQSCCMFHLRSTTLSRINCLVVAAMIATTSLGAQFFVAPGGTDQNPGTRQKPFGPIATARDAGVKTVTLNISADSRENQTRTAPQENVRGPEGNMLAMAFVEVKAGRFEMGSNDGDDDEKPVREVRITQDFWMGKYEVTQRDYQQLMGSNPSHFKGENLPVEMVSWNDAVHFCEALTDRERKAGRLPQGYVYRLPTEAEWEYAARGGSKSKKMKYAGSDTIGDVAWYRENSEAKTHPVGTKNPNELGLYDMSGNVWEWVDPIDPKTGLSRACSGGGCGPENYSTCVFRGGGWGDKAVWCRVANRSKYLPTVTAYLLGFRMALGPAL